MSFSYLRTYVYFFASNLLIILFFSTSYVYASPFLMSYETNVNLRAFVPDLIDKDLVYDKKDELYKIDKNIVISKTGKLTFKNNSRIHINGGGIVNNNINNETGILIEKSNLVGVKANILSTLTLQDSILTFSDGKINKLIVMGTADIAVKGTIFDTLEFIKLGATDGSKTGVALDKVKVKNININIDGLDNKFKRNINIKDSEIDNIIFKGYLNVVSDGVNEAVLKTNFNFIKDKIKLVDYTDDKLQELIILPNNSPTGFLNFNDTTIEDMKVSYNLLRGITLNGATITNLKIEHTNLAKPENSLSDNKLKDEDPNIPSRPTYSNLQLVGLGTSFIKNLDFNSAKIFNIEGEIATSSYNAPLSSIYIQKLSNYRDTSISLYNLKDVYFGIERPKKEKPEDKPNKPKVIPHEKEKIPGGSLDTINITRLFRVSTLGIYDNTVKFNWDLEKNKKYNYNQYLSVYNISQLKLVNSLVDVSKTADLKIRAEIKNDKGDVIEFSDKDPDPRKFNTIYDYNITYEGSMSAFGSIFHFENSGAIKNDNRKLYIPLRMRVRGNSFVTAKDMHSDLDMQLNGERNIFVLESNKYNSNYTFHTNYNYAYLKPKDGKHKPGAQSLQYNYWDYNENVRVEQNWYTFKTDILIVDPKSKEYNEYKNNYSSLLNGENNFATAWFTYWQPYKVDENGNPNLNKDKNKDDDKKFNHGDQLAWDQKTDGTGRGGFPVEFGNKIQVEDAKVTLLKPLDNLTVLEVVGKGNVNFHDMDAKHVSTKKSQWITILRMRGGILSMAKVPMYVDKLQVYSYGLINEATFRPIFEVKNGTRIDEIFSNQKLVVNKEANFKNNYLKVDLYFNDYFLNLNQKVTLNILELGEYKQKIKEKEGDKEVEKEVIKQAVIKNLKGVNFEQGLLFDTNYYWKDRNLFVEITRTKNFKYFIKNNDSTISNILDNIIDNYTLSIDKDNKVQLLNKNKNPKLNNDTIKIVNELFKCKNIHDLTGSFASLRPINNEVIFNINNISTKQLLDSIKNSNNYSSEANKGRLVTWSNFNTSSNVINNTYEVMGSNINNNAFSIGGHTKVYNVKLGAFLGYVNSKYESAYFKGISPLYGGGIYTDVSLIKGYFMKLASLYSVTDIKGERHQYFMNDKANFKFKGNSIDFIILAGKTYLLENGFITSFISLNNGYSNFNSYKENGGSGTLDVKGFSAPYAAASFGAEYAKEISILNNGSLMPKLGVIYSFKYYNIKDTEARLNKLNGIKNDLNNIRYSSNNYGKNSILINAGLNYILSYKVTLSSNFNAEIINKDIKGYNIFFGYKHSF